MPLKDECGICGRVLPYSYLRRCQRCGRLFCRDCMVPDVSTGDTNKMLCLHCARKIVSPKSNTKYGALTSYLKFRAAFTDTVKLSLAEMDGIIRDNLPLNAYKNEKWWNNTPTNAHAKAWMDAGWKVQETNLKEGYVIFQKIKELPTKRFRKKALSSKIKKPFTPIPVRILKSSKPSKTKVSKLYARLKNIERQRATIPIYPGSFKPKPRHEKKTV
jgi:hypothetical protein